MRALTALPRDLLDLIAPPRCAACDATYPGEALCALCRDALLPAEESPEGVRAVYLHGGPIASAIHRAKYGEDPRVASRLGALLLPVLPERAGLVIPIPLHRRRLIARGFNQAAQLAAPVARHLGATLLREGLLRVRETPSQTTLDRGHRAANLAGALVVPRAEVVRGRTVVVVDDVSTTGATMRAAFAALRAAGAAEVCGVVLAAAALRISSARRSPGG